MVVSFAKSSKRSRFNRRLKNSVHPSTGLRANGISLEITSKYPFMLSQVEACKLFFNSLSTFNMILGSLIGRSQRVLRRLEG